MIGLVNARVPELSNLILLHQVGFAKLFIAWQILPLMVNTHS